MTGILRYNSWYKMAWTIEFRKDFLELRTNSAVKLKIASLILAAAMLSGCAYRSQQETEESPVETKSTLETTIVDAGGPDVKQEAFYSSEVSKLSVPIPDDKKDMSRIYLETMNPKFVGDRILVYVFSTYEAVPGIEETLTDNFYAIFDMNGNYLNRLKADDLPNDAAFTVDKDGNLVMVCSEYRESGEHWQNILVFAKFDWDGNLIEEPNDVQYEADSFVTGVVSTDAGIVITTPGHIIQTDSHGIPIASICFDTDTGARGLWQENGKTYLYLASYNMDGDAYLGELLEVNVEARGEIDLKNTGRNAESLSGMKVYQTDTGTYAATRNALGKINLSTGEFSRLLDWNQTDIDRSILRYSPVKVISEGELSQTVNVLPYEDINAHDYTVSIAPNEVEQPSEEPPEVVPSDGHIEEIPAGADDTAITEPVISDGDETIVAKEMDIDETSVIADSFIDESTSSSTATTGEGETKVCILTTKVTEDGAWTELIKIAPSDKNPHEGKDVVWVGGVGLTDTPLMQCIAEFNKNSTKDVWIKVYDYADFRYDGSIGSAKYKEKALATMAAQVDSGVGPDIIIGAGETGVFDNSRDLTNLNGYIDSPSGIDRSKYFDSVLKAFETDGKLYQIPLLFHVYAIIGNREFTDGKTEMNYHDYTSARMLLDDEKSLFSGTSVETLLNLFVKGETASWINFSNDTVNIDRNSLIDMLEFLKIEAYSGDCSYFEFDSEYEYKGPVFSYNGIESVFERQTAFCLGNVNSIVDYLEGNILGDTTCWYGCPGSEGSTPLVKTQLSAGIASYSMQKDQAWEVIKYFISNEVQTAIRETQLCDGFYFDWPIPVNKAAFREENKGFITDNEDVYSYAYDSDGNPVIIDAGNVDALLKEYESFLDQPMRRYIREDEVLDIVREEVMTYLRENCTVTEAADNIIERITKTVQG